ncbi:hypothetical protein [Phytohabitans rumicis]|uniref:Uncharacterized protein n=1 Tax=Phytohabitans rumicis TaxID=1076125 RepID=A0A6V8L2P4_9ACTN|nr:hypothetical protein [Phytohabitans rumicis]GFJ91572.1 hypothetical protein Prum_052140 [Phytohabitans rumicis]
MPIDWDLVLRERDSLARRLAERFKEAEKLRARIAELETSHTHCRPARCDVCGAVTVCDAKPHTCDTPDVCDRCRVPTDPNRTCARTQRGRTDGGCPECGACKDCISLAEQCAQPDPPEQP